jgi:hypothetical protein
LRLALALSLAAGCAAGARLERGAYVVREKGYRVVAPVGWRRIESEADVALRHPVAGAGLLAHGSCDGRTPDRPVVVLSRHLRFGLRDVRLLEEARIEVAGLPGVRTRFAARLDDVPVTVSAVTLRGPRCAYDLALVASPEGFAGVAGDFARFVESFGLTPGTP